MEKRLGVIAVVVENHRENALEVQKILSDYSSVIVGRMGIPDKENDISVISIIVKGENEVISALTGKLGRLSKVSVKSALTSKKCQ